MKALGIDLGCTNMKAAVLDGEDGGRPCRIATRPTPATAEAEAIVATAAEFGAEMIASEQDIQAIGVALPGHFDPDRGTGVCLPNLGTGRWEDRPIAEPLSVAFGRPVRLVNDARALALAELRLGALSGCRHGVCLTLGTGVGGAIIFDGRLYLGTGHAGEIGHMVAVPDGPRCGCGNRGCLDRVVSSAAIAADAGRDTVEAAATAATGGDEQALEAFVHAARHIARILADVVVLIWPERILIGGGIAGAGGHLLQPLQAELRRRTHLVAIDQISVVLAALGPTAGAVGAALWAREQARGLSGQPGRW